MRKYEPSIIQIYGGNCHSLVLILILMPIKTRIDNTFGQNTTQPPTRNSTLFDIVKNINISGYLSKKSCLGKV